MESRHSTSHFSTIMIVQAIRSSRTPLSRWSKPGLASPGASLFRHGLRNPSSASSRPYSTPPPPPPHPSSRLRSPLVISAATGFAAGLIFTLTRQYSSADSTRLDGAPALTAVETFGESWEPVDAIEKDDARNPMRVRMATWVKSLQDHIVTTLESIEQTPLPSSHPSATSSPGTFHRDTWIRPEGGEGSSCVLSNGRIFERAGVNVSIVHGSLPPAAQKAMRSDHPTLPSPGEEGGSLPFSATGLSIVLHPRSPHIPTVHLNYRYFELEDPKKPGETVSWWFGGGSDLTPSYLVEEDVRHFHKTLKDACDKHHDGYWGVFKPWCDKYFYIPHRKESRGVGGFFFDDLTTESDIHSSSSSAAASIFGKKQQEKPKPTREELFAFVQSASSAFLPAYLPIVQRNYMKSWTDEERRWQLLRRGRYVEFNLVYDRGTKFGLATPGARIESILMSLPETARWEYMSPMGSQGEEAKLLEVCRNPKDWA